MELISEIASIPLFADLPKPQLAELAMIVVDQLLPRGLTIFGEGDEATGFYVVISGRVKIYKLSADGKEQIIHIFGGGEPFGEVPVFAGQLFPAWAETLEDSRIFFFPRDAFIKLIQQDPSLALNMLAVLSRRLRQLVFLIEGLSLKEVPGRLAAHFLLLSERQDGADEVELDLAKGQLASLLGTIPETLSRILAKMSKQGFILTTGPRIKILNRPGLQELATEGRRL
jgi:CRP/FNR family transcriptional regulator, dissimilatory nitrate respiration regulator